jgi:hypothetical protein
MPDRCAQMLLLAKTEDKKQGQKGPEIVIPGKKNGRVS